MHGQFNSFMALIPFMLFMVPMAITAGWLAPRMGDRS
jgi:hypothetical protein